MRNFTRMVFLSSFLVMSGLPLTGSAELSQVHIRALAATCAACHGTNGANVETHYQIAESPKSLAGINASFFIEQMTKFRTDKRQGTVMNHYAKGLNEAEIQALSQYFSQLKPSHPTLPHTKLSTKH